MARLGIVRLLVYTISAVVLLWFLAATRPDDPSLFLTRLNQLDLLVAQRIMIWDFKDNEEEISCRGPHAPSREKEPIPNVVHYVLLSEGDGVASISYRTFLSFKATLLRMKPDKVKLHTYGLDTANEWWKLLEKHVELVEYNRTTLKGPNDTPLTNFRVQHQSDILRLAILQREGGIYFDTDIYPFKPFTDLLNCPRDMIMGHEGGIRYGFGNAVILARSSSDFLQKWIESYSTFDDWYWNYHSIRMPKLLQVQAPETICPLSPSAFLWPTWGHQHTQYMQGHITAETADDLRHRMAAYGGAMYENQLTVHHSDNLTPERVLNEDTRFNILMRDLVDAPLR